MPHKNPDERKKYLHDWRLKNPDKVAGQNERSRDRRIKYLKEWRAKNPDKLKKYHQQYRERYPEKWREIRKNLRQRHKAKTAVKRRAFELRKRYGIDVAEYQRMFTEQNGRCALCTKPSKSTLAVDHDHANGRVRGLLCHPCNLALGRVERIDRSLLESYLRGSMTVVKEKA